MRHTLFISDLHLDTTRPETTELFLQLMREHAPQADALYILGDFFEAWIGDEDNNDFHKRIKTSLRELKIQKFFMHGNRDFLVGKKFSEETGCQLLKDPTCIDLYGAKILLAHGDLLCSDDVKHLRFRKITSMNWFHHGAACIPLSIKRWLAKKLRLVSEAGKQHKAQHIMDVNQKAVENVMQEHNANTLIHGHTHRLDTHKLELNGAEAQRIVLGDWYTDGNALVYNEDGSFKWLFLPHNKNET